MEVGEFIVHDFFVYLGLGCEEERLQRGEETKIKKKLIRWIRAQSKKADNWVQFYYESAIKNISLLFKISSEHILKNVV